MVTGNTIAERHFNYKAIRSQRFSLVKEAVTPSSCQPRWRIIVFSDLSDVMEGQKDFPVPLFEYLGGEFLYNEALEYCSMLNAGQLSPEEM